MIIAGRVPQGAGRSRRRSRRSGDLTHCTSTAPGHGNDQRLDQPGVRARGGGLLLYACRHGWHLLAHGHCLRAIAILLWSVPAAPPVPRATGRILDVLLDPAADAAQFRRLLPASHQTAMWVLVPSAPGLRQSALAEHWKVYLPAVLVSFVVHGAGRDHGGETRSA